MVAILSGIVGVTCALLWLLLLVGTNFNGVAISVGLLAVVCVTDRAR